MQIDYGWYNPNWKTHILVLFLMGSIPFYQGKFKDIFIFTYFLGLLLEIYLFKNFFPILRHEKKDLNCLQTYVDEERMSKF